MCIRDRKKEVTSVLIGASRPEQILKNLEAVRKHEKAKLPEEELQKIDEAIK